MRDHVYLFAASNCGIHLDHLGGWLLGVLVISYRASIYLFIFCGFALGCEKNNLDETMMHEARMVKKS